MSRHVIIDLKPDEYNQRVHCYSFMVNLQRCIQNFNTLDDLSSRICVPNKIEDVNLCVLNMMAQINEYKILTKCMQFLHKFDFDGGKCNSNKMWNDGKY